MANKVSCRLCPRQFASLQELYDHVEVHAVDQDEDGTDASEDEESSTESSSSSSYCSNQSADEDSEPETGDLRLGYPIKNGHHAHNVLSQQEREEAEQSEESDSEDEEEEEDQEETSESEEEDVPSHQPSISNGYSDVSKTQFQNQSSQKQQRSPEKLPSQKTDPQAETFACHMCPRVYRSKYTRNSHMKRDHQVVPLDDKYYCSPCDKIFTRKREFVRHQRTEHSEKKPRRRRAPNPLPSESSRKPPALAKKKPFLLRRKEDKGEAERVLAGLTKTFGEQLSEDECSVKKEETVDLACDVCGYEVVCRMKMKSHMYAHVDDLDTESWMRAYTKCGVLPAVGRNGVGEQNGDVSSSDDDLVSDSSGDEEGVVVNGSRSNSYLVSSTNGFHGGEVSKRITIVVLPYFNTPDHILLDSAPNLGPLISRWEINKFEYY